MSEIKVEVNWNDAFKDRVIEEFKQSIIDGAEFILTESQPEVPKETGTLLRSGTVVTKEEGSSITASPVYNTPYAAAVHEGTGVYGPEGLPIVINAVNKKTLAVPIQKWGDRPVNPYGSGKLPMLSKDGRFVLLGKRVIQYGQKGRKYLERPFNANKSKVIKLSQLRVARALKG